MAGRVSVGRISDSEFSNLLQALSATTKGRAFLAEYARRGRPDETVSLFESLQRIEATVATLREQIQPELIADELRRIGMTLEIAADGVAADPEGDETARRFALIGEVRRELAALADGLAGKPAVGAEAAKPAQTERSEPTERPAQRELAGRFEPPAIQLTDDETAFYDQLGFADAGASADR